MDFNVPARDLPVSHPVAEAPLCGDVSGGGRGRGGGECTYTEHDGVVRAEKYSREI